MGGASLFITMSHVFKELLMIYFIWNCCTWDEIVKGSRIDELKINEKLMMSNIHLSEPIYKHKLKPNEKRHFPSLKNASSLYRKRRLTDNFNYTWPIKHVVHIKGDIMLGGLMMIHEREDVRICGPIMPQGGIQALECMLYTMDWVNDQEDFLPGFKLGAYVLDDCDKDTYGLEQAVDFIKGQTVHIHIANTMESPKGKVPEALEIEHKTKDINGISHYEYAMHRSGELILIYGFD
ncbi:uncharacterized protein LOC118184334 [Stegodyphus dumicola]|uniref:uncharacterized protein LOC118184334 n=1 Tax=Stegodyphus dumicola TaxID=202533 RepID=UPI0015A90C1B|nr:uncharacterized protein LOC118184334 [Stegodyphus dumicola]